MKKLTVNELHAALGVLIEEGHGNDVVVARENQSKFNDVWDCSNYVTSVVVATGVSQGFIASSTVGILFEA